MLQKAVSMNASIYVWRKNVILNEELHILEKTGLLCECLKNRQWIRELEFKFIEDFCEGRRKCFKIKLINDAGGAGLMEKKRFVKAVVWKGNGM